MPAQATDRPLKRTGYGLCRARCTIALFGSMARGNATATSDVDLAVRFSHTIDLFELASIKLAIEKVVGRPVQRSIPHLGCFSG